MKKVLFISSSGGHLEQLLSLKETMQHFDSYIITEKNQTTEDLDKKYANLFYLPFFSRENKWTFPFVFMGVFFKSISHFFKIKPDIIVSTGAGCVIPMFLIGKLFGKKLIFIETFSRTDSKTLTGKVCYLFADTFIVQWEGLLNLYPKAKYFGPIY